MILALSDPQTTGIFHSMNCIDQVNLSLTCFIDAVFVYCEF